MEDASQDVVTPFFFGAQNRSLFGLYHLPQPGQERDLGVVLCNPWGQEYIRTHRSLSQLGVRLARLGFPVLRFDFFGTGDSAGDDNEGSFQQWQSDLRSAIQELKRRSRVETVYLVGLRLGASLAALVASGRDDVDGVVLWEPVVQGTEYLQDLIAWHRNKQLYSLNKASVGSESSELLGSGLHPDLMDDLGALDLLLLNRKPAEQILLIEGAAGPDETRESVQRLNQHLLGLGARVDYRLISSFKLWEENPDKGLVPQPILEAVVGWLAQEPV